MTDKANATHRENVLKIGTTLSVTLARQKIALGRVLSLTPGAILPLDKPYAEPVQLAAADHPLAQGEVVQVGDRFGIRILQLLKAAPPRR